MGLEQYINMMIINNKGTSNNNNSIGSSLVGTVYRIKSLLLIA